MNEQELKRELSERYAPNSAMQRALDAADSTVSVVFDLESSPPMPLGLYIRTDGTVVIYEGPRDYGEAPEDCVVVVRVQVPDGRRV